MHVNIKNIRKKVKDCEDFLQKFTITKYDRIVSSWYGNQSVAAMIAVVAVPIVAVPTGHWRSTVTGVTTPFRRFAGSFN